MPTPVPLYQVHALEDGSCELTAYNGTEPVVTIPDTIDGRKVTAIAAGAFSANEQLRLVTLPHTITVIEPFAFTGCTALEYLALPEKVESIGSSAFYNCASLKALYVPATVRSIDKNAFADCDKLVLYTPAGSAAEAYANDNSIPLVIASDEQPVLDLMTGRSFTCIVTSYDTCAISGFVGKATNLSIPAFIEGRRVTGIYRDAFKDNAMLQSITLPEGIVNISPSAFENCTALQSIVLPSTLNTIGEKAFFGCSSLSAIDLPPAVNMIGPNAFTASALQQIDLSALPGLTQMSDYTFARCASLQKVVLPKNLLTIGNACFYKCEALASVSLPAALQAVGESAFSHCKALASIALPNSVQAIGNNAFTQCKALREVRMPAKLSTLGNHCFSGCSSLISIQIPEGPVSIPDYAFFNCQSLESVVLPNSLQSIDWASFSDCTSLKNISIPAETQTIISLAFSSCSSLEYLVLPENLEIIYSSVFQKCTSLKALYVPASVHSIEKDAFADCDKLVLYTPAGSAAEAYAHDNNIPVVAAESAQPVLDLMAGLSFTYKVTGDASCLITGFNGEAASLSVPAFIDGYRVTGIDKYAFRNHKTLESITLPEGLTQIGPSAFENCTALQSVTLPSTLDVISGNAFANCTSLSEISLPPNMRAISSNAFTATALREVNLSDCTKLLELGDYAFARCDALKKITLPQGLRAIGNGCFYKCEALASITLPESVETIGESAFSMCKALREVRMPAQLEALGAACFSGCSALRSIQVPEGVGELGANTFQACTALQTVTLPQSLRSIGREAFSYCTALQKLRIPALVGAIYGGPFTTVIGPFEECPRLVLEVAGNSYAHAWAALDIQSFRTYQADEYAPAPQHTCELTETAPGSLRLNWQPVSSCDGYIVSMSRDGGKYEEVLRTDSALHHELSLSDLARGSHYAFTITPCTETPKGAEVLLPMLYAPAEITLSVPEISAPTDVSAMQLDDERVLLRWTADPDASGSVLYASVDGGIYREQGETTGSEMLLEDLKTASAYSWRLTSFYTTANGRMESDFSQAQSLTLHSFIPQFNPFEQIDSDSARLSWTPVEGAHGYVLYQLAEDGTATYKTSTPEAEYVLNVLQQNTPITYKVASYVMVDGERNVSELSAPLTVTLKDWQPVFGDFEYEYNGTFTGVSIVGYTGTGGHVVVPDTIDGLPVTAIDERAFNNSSIRSISLPESITAIRASAFKNCTQLTSIELPDSVRYVGESAFAGCTALKSVVLPDKLSSIEEYLFYNCSSLTTIQFPSALLRIEKLAFPRCESLVEMTLPESVSEVDDHAFVGCTSLKRIALPSSLSRIGAKAFSGCTSLESLTLPSSLQQIEDMSFSNCTSLSDVVLPEKLQAIQSRAFYGCESLEGLFLPESISTIAGDAFSGCSNLIVHTISGSAAHEYVRKNSVPHFDYLLLKDGTYAIGGDPDKENLVVPDSFNGKPITALRNDAFLGYSDLVSVTLPHTITSLGHQAFSGCLNLQEVVLPEGLLSIGQRAFYSCYALKAVELPDSLNTIAHSGFSGCTALEAVSLPDGLELLDNYAFVNCTSLTDVRLPQNLAVLNDGVFSGCTSLTSIDLPDSLTEIRKAAFRDCTALASITLPQSLKVIGDEAFSNCHQLRSVDLPHELDALGRYAFSNCSQLDSVELPGGLTTVASYAFSNCSSLKTALLPETITTIQTNAFARCSSLYRINLPHGLVSIGQSAFADCHMLTDVELPETLAELGDACFSDCYSITDITIPEAVQAVPAKAFQNASMLRSVTLPETLTAIGAYAFEGCTTLPSIHLPDSVNSIDTGAFYQCISLEEISLPEGITTVKERLFAKCSSLQTVTLPSTVTSILYESFESCSSLNSLVLPETVDLISTVFSRTPFDNCPNLALAVKPNSFAHTYAKQNKLAFTTYTDTLPQPSPAPEATPVPVTSSKLFETAAAPNNSVEIVAYTGNETHVNVPSVINKKKVTAIGSNAFADQTQLRSVILPDTINTIGSGAFSGCTSLQSIELPDSITLIGKGAFRDCRLLNHVDLPSSLANLAEELFMGCLSLTDIQLPFTLIGVGNSAFQGCSALTDLSFGNGLKWIGISSFEQCYSLKNIVLPNTIFSIKPLAFADCLSLEKLSLPSWLSSISPTAFDGCPQLKLLVEPGSYAEDYARKHDFIWESSSTAPAMTGETFVSGDYAAALLEDGGCAITAYTGHDAILAVPEELNGHAVRSIGSEAFKGNDSLVKFTLPQGVVYIGDHAFDGCLRLESAVLPNSVTAIDAYAFAHCVALEDFTPGASLASIGDSAFWGCKSLNGLALPDTLTTIDAGAFSYCTGLENLKLPHALLFIGERAFSGCENMNLFVSSGSYSEYYAQLNGLKHNLYHQQANGLTFQLATAANWAEYRSMSSFCASLCDQQPVVLCGPEGKVAGYEGEADKAPVLAVPEHGRLIIRDTSFDSLFLIANGDVELQNVKAEHVMLRPEGKNALTFSLTLDEACVIEAKDNTAAIQWQASSSDQERNLQYTITNHGRISSNKIGIDLSRSHLRSTTSCTTDYVLRNYGDISGAESGVRFLIMDNSAVIRTNVENFNTISSSKGEALVFSIGSANSHTAHIVNHQDASLKGTTYAVSMGCCNSWLRNGKKMLNVENDGSIRGGFSFASYANEVPEFRFTGNGTWTPGEKRGLLVRLAGGDTPVASDTARALTDVLVEKSGLKLWGKTISARIEIPLGAKDEVYTASYTPITFVKTDKCYVATDTPIYAEPSMHFGTIGTIPLGAILYPDQVSKGKEPEWLHVVYNGLDGYVRVEDVTDVSANTPLNGYLSAVKLTATSKDDSWNYPKNNNITYKNNKGTPVNWILKLILPLEDYSAKPEVSWLNHAPARCRISTMWESAHTETGYAAYSKIQKKPFEFGYLICLPDDPSLAGEQSITCHIKDLIYTIGFTLEYVGDYETGTGWKVTDAALQSVEPADALTGARYGFYNERALEIISKFEQLDVRMEHRYATESPEVGEAPVESRLIFARKGSYDANLTAAELLGEISASWDHTAEAPTPEQWRRDDGPNTEIGYVYTLPTDKDSSIKGKHTVTFHYEGMDISIPVSIEYYQSSSIIVRPGWRVTPGKLITHGFPQKEAGAYQMPPSSYSFLTATTNQYLSSGCTLYAQPLDGADSIGTIPTGTILHPDLISEGKDPKWIHVVHDGLDGYVRMGEVQELKKDSDFTQLLQSIDCWMGTGTHSADSRTGQNNRGKKVNWLLWTELPAIDGDEHDTLSVSWAPLDNSGNYWDASVNGKTSYELYSALRGKTEAILLHTPEQSAVAGAEYLPFRYDILNMSLVMGENVKTGYMLHMPDDPSIAGEQTLTFGYDGLRITMGFTLEYLGDYKTGTGWAMHNVRPLSIQPATVESGIKYGFYDEELASFLNEFQSLKVTMTSGGDRYDETIGANAQGERVMYQINFELTGPKDSGRLGDSMEVSWGELTQNDYPGWKQFKQEKKSYSFKYVGENRGEPYAGKEIILPDDPSLAGRQSVTFTKNDLQVTIPFTLVYLGNYETGTGWSVTDVGPVTARRVAQ